MSVRKPPPSVRLSVILARQASVGVILKRGPSSWVQMIKWHTDTDTFEIGQWFKGRIYANKCDLSPDGKLFIYFALKGNRVHPDYGSTWTVVSKPPYFTALTLWKEVGTWGGGGHFIDNKSIRLSISYGDFHPNHPPQGITVFYNDSNNILDAEQQERLQLANWQLIQNGNSISDVAAFLQAKSIENVPNNQSDENLFLTEENEDESGVRWITKLDPPTIWRKPDIDISLEKHCFGYQMHHGEINKLFVVKNKTNERVLLSFASWADFDQQGRFVLAKEGKLFSGALENGDLKLTELADFNGMKPDPQPAPDWAQQW